MAQMRASTVQQKRKEVHAALQYAASYHCLVEEWNDAEHQREVNLCRQKTGSEEASHRVVCSSEQISVHEVCAEQ